MPACQGASSKLGAGCEHVGELCSCRCSQERLDTNVVEEPQGAADPISCLNQFADEALQVIQEFFLQCQERRFLRCRPIQFPLEATDKHLRARDESIETPREVTERAGGFRFIELGCGEKSDQFVERVGDVAQCGGGKLSGPLGALFVERQSALGHVAGGRELIKVFWVEVFLERASRHHVTCRA